MQHLDLDVADGDEVAVVQLAAGLAVLAEVPDRPVARVEVRRRPVRLYEVAHHRDVVVVGG